MLELNEQKNQISLDDTIGYNTIPNLRYPDSFKSWLVYYIPMKHMK